MKINILKNEKNNMELELDNLTVAEILRVYLQNDENVVFAAWKREHPSKPIILKVETKNKSARKAIEDAISNIQKESEKLANEVKKL